MNRHAIKNLKIIRDSVKKRRESRSVVIKNGAIVMLVVVITILVGFSVAAINSYFLRYAS